MHTHKKETTCKKEFCGSVLGHLLLHRVLSATPTVYSKGRDAGKSESGPITLLRPSPSSTLQKAVSPSLLNRPFPSPTSEEENFQFPIYRCADLGSNSKGSLNGSRDESLCLEISGSLSEFVESRIVYR